MPKLKIKKDATVEVISGADKGKRGAVLAIDSAKLKLIVQGVRIQTHFDKQEGIQKKEAFIDYSNVKLIEQAPPKGKKAKKTKKVAAKA